MADRLNAREGIQAFVVWLSSRTERVVLGGQTAPKISELVEAFCESNRLNATREDWDDFVIWPDHVDAWEGELDDLLTYYPFQMEALRTVMDLPDSVDGMRIRQRKEYYAQAVELKAAYYWDETGGG